MAEEPKVNFNHPKCSRCRHYLSFSPIRSDIHGNYCARCSPKSPNAIFNNIYVEACQAHTFPCTYEKHGCREQYKFGDAIKNHEQVCPFGPVRCSQWFDATCRWKGMKTNVIRHVKEDHEDLLVDEPRVEIDLRKNFSASMLFSREEPRYILHVSYVKNGDLSVKVIEPNGTESTSVRGECEIEIGSVRKSNRLFLTRKIHSRFTADFLDNPIDSKAIKSVVDDETIYLEVIADEISE